MTRAYIYYPTPSSIKNYGDEVSNHYRKHNKAGQRQIVINSQTLGPELDKFRTKQHIFRAKPVYNDMYLEIDFNDRRFENEILAYIQRLIGLHYEPLSPNRTEIQYLG